MSGYVSFVEARASQADQLRAAIGRSAEQIRARQAEGELRGPGPLFVGIGNSLAATCAPVWTLRSRAIHSWRLGAGDHPIPFPSTRHPIIGVSQSGRSPETLAVLTSADAPHRYAVVNVDPSPLANAVDTLVHLGNIPDSYASTIGFTATVAALGLIADAWDGGEFDQGWARLPDLLGSLETMLADRLPEVATGLARAHYADVVGTPESVGSAESGAVLLREVARLPSTAMSTREYLHGAMESAGDGIHVLLGDGRELGMADTLAGSGHRVLLVTSAAVAEGPNLRVIRIPAAPASQRAVLEALVLQSLAGALAEQQDIDIEQFVFHHADTKVAATE
jgi:glucosamine--fructose-6-phosphate aminotransferase (isomerizing)